MVELSHRIQRGVGHIPIYPPCSQKSKFMKMSFTSRDSLEILQKLQHFKLIDIISSYGEGESRKFYEARSLAESIGHFIIAHEGRLQLTEIARHFQIDRSETKRVLLSYAPAKLETCHFIPSSDEFISESYVQTTISNIDTIIDGSGKISPAGLAKLLQLPLEFTLDRIIRSPTVQGKMKNGQLYSHRLLEEMSSQVYSLCDQATTAPLSFVSIASSLRVEEAMVAELITAGLITGKLQGEVIAQSFHHVILIESSKSSIFTDFQRQGFLYLSQVKQRVATSKTLDYVKANCSHFTALTNLIIAPELIKRIEDAVKPPVEVAASTPMIISLPALLPSEIRVEDAKEIIAYVMKLLSSVSSTNTKKKAVEVQLAYYVMDSGIAVHRGVLVKLRGAIYRDLLARRQLICDKLYQRFSSTMEKESKASAVATSPKKKVTSSKAKGSSASASQSGVISVEQQLHQLVHEESVRVLSQHYCLEIWRKHDEIKGLLVEEESSALPASCQWVSGKIVTSAC
jgi:hypothetical protein